MFKCKVFVFILAASGVLTLNAQPTRLISGDHGFFMQPIWSPDGSQIAFTSTKYQGLWVMNADGSQVRQISDEPAAGFGFSWSGDSKAILTRVAKFERSYRYNAVKVFDLATNGSWLLTDYQTLMPDLPQWVGADEKVCLFNRGNLEIFDSRYKSSALQKFGTDNRIYFLKDDRPAIGNVETQIITVLEPLKDRRYLNLVASPDRSKLTFEIMGGNLYILDIENNNLLDVGTGHRPGWAPDSKHIVYMITQDDGYQYLSSDIWIYHADSQEKTQLTFTDEMLEMNPCWSPDGKKIAYDDLTDGSIYVLERIK